MPPSRRSWRRATAEGYESATIAEVAPQSAVNPGLVARHYGSKAEGATP